MSHKKKFHIALFVLLLIFGLAVTGILTYQEYTARRKTLNMLMENRAKQMESSVMESLDDVYILKALVLGAKGGKVDLTSIGFALDLDADTRNILLAPNGIVSDVYPLEGNENVIGLDLYSDNNASSDDAVRARETGELVVTGPYELVQGGQAISGRIDVELPMEDGSMRDWGLVSVTLKFPEVMQNTLTDALEDAGYLYRVLKRNNETNEYYDLLEYGFDAAENYETYDFTIQGMIFRMNAYPADGWFNYKKIIIQIFSIIMAAFIVDWGIVVVMHHGKMINEKVTRDSLTGIFNRDYAKKMITKLMHSKQYRSGVFMLLDLDNFKSVNDNIGHQCGDQLLIETAQILLRSCRESDIVCRLGGDEFIIYMECKDPDSFLPRKLEQIRRTLQRIVSLEDKLIEVTGSIGVAIAPQDGSDFDALYKCADKALYIAKRNGRNRYVYYSQVIEEENLNEKIYKSDQQQEYTIL